MLSRIVRWLWIWDRPAGQIPIEEMLTVNGFFRYLVWPIIVFAACMVLWIYYGIGS